MFGSSPQSAAMEATSQANGRTIGPHSRRIALGMIDGRRREARLMREVRDELIQHCGGRPSTVQRKLCERAAVLALRLALLDAKAPDGSLTERDAREYLCWHNAYVRTLRELGMKGAAERPPTLAELLAQPPASGQHAEPDAAADAEGADAPQAPSGQPEPATVAA